MKYDYTQHCGNIPDEMKTLDQWCVAVGNKAPKILGESGLINTSVIGDKWMSFNDAVTVAKQYGGEIGFILTRNDPYVCIDLDVKDPESLNSDGTPYNGAYTTQEQLDRFVSILDTCDSYAELSSSGKGLHIWLKGKLQCGNRRDGVEVYPHERFIICTGKIVSKIKYTVGKREVDVEVIGWDNKPIADRQDLLDVMIKEITKQMKKNPAESFELVEVEPIETDDKLFQMAASADNSEKFIDLCNGHWQKYKYPSQSEADNALLSMLAFYSKSNEQVRRMFRMTGLGKRDKATKNNSYIDRTLTYIRRNQANKVDIEINLEKQTKQLFEQASNMHEEMFPEIETGKLDWPPGNAAIISKFIYDSSFMPVKEISIAATLGFLSGLLGRAYNVSRSGLNNYVVLVAKSGTGKEAMTTGINLIVNAVKSGVPGITKYVNYNSIVSGPALSKMFGESPSFVNINAEWGQTLKRMADTGNPTSPAASLRRTMTELYQKSGEGAIFGGMTYSNAINHIDSTISPAFSILAESTPDTFYSSLTDSMMEDGLVSRLTIIESDIMRPDENDNVINKPNIELIDLVSEVTRKVIELNGLNQRIHVTLDQGATALNKAFSAECNAKLKVIEDESFRALWNRANLKVLRIAALLAIMDDYKNPIIKVNHFEWALDLTRRDMSIISNRLLTGDVGSDDITREAKMLGVIEKYLKFKVKDIYGTKGKTYDKLRSKNIIPNKYIFHKCKGSSCFTTHKFGVCNAINNSVLNLINTGVLQEVPKDEIFKLTGEIVSGKCFHVDYLR